MVASARPRRVAGERGQFGRIRSNSRRVRRAVVVQSQGGPGRLASSAFSKSIPRMSFEHQRHKPPRELAQPRELLVVCAPLRSNVNLSRIVRMPDIEREVSIRMDETPMAVYQEQIRARVAAEGRVAFSLFFDGEKMQSRIVGVFLAILELIRHEHYRAEQPLDFGEIYILAPR